MMVPEISNTGQATYETRRLTSGVILQSHRIFSSGSRPRLRELVPKKVRPSSDRRDSAFNVELGQPNLSKSGAVAAGLTERLQDGYAGCHERRPGDPLRRC